MSDFINHYCNNNDQMPTLDSLYNLPLSRHGSEQDDRSAVINEQERPDLHRLVAGPRNSDSRFGLSVWMAMHSAVSSSVSYTLA